MIRKTAHLTYKTARRIAILTVGSTVLLLGIIMLVTPGPGHTRCRIRLGQDLAAQGAREYQQPQLQESGEAGGTAS